MFKFGLKLWSKNQNYINDAKKLFEQGVYDYIELYAEPGSYDSFINSWAALKIPYIIHAPHWFGGMNLAKKEAEVTNSLLIKETLKWANDLDAQYIIFHGGVDGDYKETARQLQNIKEPRSLIENKPYHSIYGPEICNGSTPIEIKYIMDEAKIDFCFDVGHAICASNACGVVWREYINDFLTLSPKMFHLSDGNINDIKDEHRNIGFGSFPIREILSLIPENSLITLETQKASKDNLLDFEHDIRAVKNYV
ncbi:MAG: TIM barrel protein [Oligoflexia bacterium]|nr:TIM barrel protein [Oligoflexia bacterium]